MRKDEDGRRGDGGGGAILQKSGRTLCCDKKCSDFFESALTALPQIIQCDLL